MPLLDDDPRHAGGYALHARIGGGGMGQVYLSYTHGGRPLAIKVIRAEFAYDAEFRVRFARHSRRRRATVIDFGIARAADATALTGTGRSVGTPAFMAPEQAQGALVQPATDVFSLGTLIAYAATGASPFGDGNDTSLLHRIVPPDLNGCPAQLRPIVERCLSKDPNARPTPALIIDFCAQAAGASRLRLGVGWLPSTIMDEVARRAQARPPELPQTEDQFVEPPSRPPRRGRLAVAAAAVTAIALIAAWSLARELGSPDRATRTSATSPATTLATTPAPGASSAAPPTQTHTPDATTPTPVASTGQPSGSASTSPTGTPTQASAGSTAKFPPFTITDIEWPKSYNLIMGEGVQRPYLDDSAGIHYMVYFGPAGGFPGGTTDGFS